jgi:hypothetical protein
VVSSVPVTILKRGGPRLADEFVSEVQLLTANTPSTSSTSGAARPRRSVKCATLDAIWMGRSVRPSGSSKLPRLGALVLLAALVTLANYSYYHKVGGPTSQRLPPRCRRSLVTTSQRRRRGRSV